MGFIPYDIDIDLLGIHFWGYLNTCMMVFELLYIFSLVLLTLHAYLEMATTMIIYQIIEDLGAKRKKKGLINKICNWFQFGFHSWDMEPKIYF
jgi:hypothetical protein